MTGVVDAAKITLKSMRGIHLGGTLSQPSVFLKSSLLENCLNWFLPELNTRLFHPLMRDFPNHQLPHEPRAMIGYHSQTLALLKENQQESVDVRHFFQNQISGDPGRPPFFKTVLLLYRRYCAARTEELREKTFHLGLIEILEEDLRALDSVVSQGWFEKIDAMRLPKLKDFVPIQYIEQPPENPYGLQQVLPVAPPGNLFAGRQYDEKFHILQAPALFLKDLAYFREKCETRDTQMGIAFIDIDDFKSFNTQYTESKVDRNLLPGFMRTLEAHVYHHGYAYRQGGDEYLVLLPSLSKSLAVAFLEELRCKLAALQYPEITEKTTVSIGLCIAEPDSPLTDRELRDRANQAKKFAKEHGKNRIATCSGTRLSADESEIVKP